MKGTALALHGGAGAFSSARIPAARVEEMRRDLSAALDAGAALLSRGASALDAVVAAVSVLEDSRVFNAARGAVLRRDGSVRLDASVMCGATQRAGAVSLLRRVQNPVQLARALLEREQEVLLCGEEADELAGELGLAVRPPEYFITDYRRRQLVRLLERSPAAVADASRAGAEDEPDEEEGQTVGAVALDRAGHLAAATSTGGTTNARVSRIGDSPVLGAGTWASDQSCAVSATGAGEFFLRVAFAHDVHARLTWQGVSLEQAARQALAHVVHLGGHGGCVAIDRDGNITLPFTTLAMPRAYQSAAGPRQVWVLERNELGPA
ncbi:MAG: isoaspartyl peptidase/L-asparaginase [Deltaproteobacteria bacterium]